MLKQLVQRLTTLPLVGVDVGFAAIKVVELSRADGRLLLRRVVVGPTGNAPAESLRRLIDEVGITAHRAAVGLASPQAIVKPFEFPAMPRKELAKAIQLEAEQSILNGHALKDMAVDWHLLAHGETNAQRGLLSVVPKSVVNRAIGAVKSAGLRPSIVDVEGLALWNAYWVLAGSAEPAPQTVLLINIGAQTTNLVIGKGPDQLMLVRDLELGGTALQDSAQGAEWVGEVRDSLGYARGQGGLRALDAIYVTGGGSGPNLIPMLKAVAQAPVTFWNPLNHLDRPDDLHVNEALGPLLAIAIGLALRQPS